LIFVVGWEADDLLPHLPKESTFVRNTNWESTNTTVSLVLGLQAVPVDEDFMIINGDVVADDTCFSSVAHAQQSAALCSIATTGEEEVKYRLTTRCCLKEVSKDPKYGSAVGEVMGVNKVTAADREKFELVLRQLDTTQFYDVAFSEIPMYPILMLGRRCVEIDTPDDLDEARKLFSLYESEDIE